MQKIIAVLLFVLSLESQANERITRDEILDSSVDISQYSVKKYGAVGDGKTDDHPSIEKAIRSQMSSGKVILYFPEGKYKISQTIRITAPQEMLHTVKFLVQGAGIEQTEVFVTKKNQDTFYFEDRHEGMGIQGILSDLMLGPERDKKDAGSALHVKNVKRSVFERFGTKGSKCSVRAVNTGGSYFNFNPGQSGKSHRSSCIGFE